MNYIVWILLLKYIIHYVIPPVRFFSKFPANVHLHHFCANIFMLIFLLTQFLPKMIPILSSDKGLIVKSFIDT